MEGISTWQVVVITIGGVLALAAAVNTVGNAIEKIVKAYRAGKAPDEVQDQRISALEAATAELQREAQRVAERLDRRDDGMSLIYEALLALCSHGIDGNNVDDMRTAKRKIENFLINNR